jgi:hypothetical protein
MLALLFLFRKKVPALMYGRILKTECNGMVLFLVILFKFANEVYWNRLYLITFIQCLLPTLNIGRYNIGRYCIHLALFTYILKKCK